MEDMPDRLLIELGGKESILYKISSFTTGTIRYTSGKGSIRVYIHTHHGATRFKIFLQGPWDAEGNDGPYGAGFTLDKAKEMFEKELDIYRKHLDPGEWK